MSKSDLKVAMESLQIKKPFRLPSKQPQFKAPTPVAPTTEVINETEVGSNTSISNAASVQISTQVAQETPALEQPQVQKLTQDDSITPVQSETQVVMETKDCLASMVTTDSWVNSETRVDPRTQIEPQTQEPVSTAVAEPTLVNLESTVSKPTEDAAPSRATSKTQDSNTTDIPREIVNACIQDSSIKLETDAASKLSTGFTRLPNSILMRMLGGEFIKSEMQIILVVARFTISFQRRYAPLSKSVLERQTGLRGPAVLQAVGSLCENGVLEKIPGDQYRPNQLGLKFDDEFDFFTKKGTLVGRSTSVTSVTEVVNSTPAQGESATYPQVATEAHFKDTSTNQNEFSLSKGERDSNSISDYLKKLKPLRKQQSETKAYKELTCSFTNNDVSAAFDFLVASDPERTIYHSPMAYLAVAMEQVLRSIKDQKEISETARHKQIERQQLQRNEDVARAQDEALWNRKVTLFNESFPTVEGQMREIQKRVPPIIQGAELRKNLAISSWATDMKLE